MQPGRSCKLRGKWQTSQQCRNEAYTSVKAYVASDDTAEYPWFHFVTKGASRKRINQASTKGKAYPRATSPPFLNAHGVLQQEVKWVKESDLDFTVVDFEDMMETFGMDLEYVVWLTQCYQDGMNSPTRKDFRLVMDREPVSPGSCVLVRVVLIGVCATRPGIRPTTIRQVPASQSSGYDILHGHIRATILFLL